MKNSILHVLGVTLVLSFAACVNELDENRVEVTEPSGTEVYGQELKPSAVEPDVLNIKVSQELASELEKNTGEDGFVKLAGVTSIPKDAVVSMRRLFPHAGKFEERTRKAGMHLWYVIEYDSSVQLTKAADGLMLPDVDIVEYRPKIKIAGDPVVVSYADEISPMAAASSSLPFDDPRLPSQWHYYNDGKNDFTVSGCDINVVPVWKSYTTGSPDVIVAVVDGGVDYKHEDLAANMWNNPDKSGDFKYGYNFVKNNFKVNPESHGTHVAGTIAAVNNNGIGVCGIAGGNAAKKVKGVKIMSCQIFDGDDSASGSEAIKWGADHGAVISQNSWGYVSDDITHTPKSLQDAVDYFVQNAGVDENGKQTGPMKGGLVIFAAGNENRSFSGADYDEILAVASVGADYKRAYYSNYGSWVDIAAPGGDARKGNFVLSTLPSDRYGTMQGTSMACPHVSGVAALIVSKFGGTDFTPKSLRKKLLDGVTDISSFNKSFYIGKGLVNAYRSIVGKSGKAPDTPSSLAVSATSNTVEFSVKVPADSDDGLPTSIILYYSVQDFNDIANLEFAQFYVGDLQEGETLEGSVSGLEFNKEYYVAAAAMDLAGNRSRITSTVKVTTGDNNAPVITPLTNTEVRIKPHQTETVSFDVAEPDKHFFNVELIPTVEGIVLDTLNKQAPKVVISGSRIQTGNYSTRLVVTDMYGLEASQEISYTVLENQSPRVKENFQDRIYDSKAAVTTELKASDYFIDDDGEDLSYTITSDKENVANMTYNNGIFYLTPMNYGQVTITVTGSDVRGATASQSFRVLVRDGSVDCETYPNPTIDYLYVRLFEESDATITIVNSTGKEVYRSVIPVSPFTPAQIDLSNHAPGQYLITVSYAGKSYRNNIIKL